MKRAHTVTDADPLDKADYNTIKEILDNCSSVIPSDKNELIQRFGNLNSPSILMNQAVKLGALNTIALLFYLSTMGSLSLFNARF